MDKQKTAEATPVGAATYIETVYGIKTFARALMIDDAQSIMDLMDDFSDHNAKAAHARITELEAKLQKCREGLEVIVKYEQRGRDKGEPRISDHWFDIAKTALKETE